MSSQVDTSSPALTTPLLTWIVRAVAAAGVLVVAWGLLTAGTAVIYGNPAYAILLLLTLMVSVFVMWRSFTHRTDRTGWRLVLRIALVIGASAWIVLMWWLRPFTAVEPALAAMTSDSKVVVTQSPTRIVMTPTSGVSPTGVFFQPGARVDARAYAAVLRPLAESGHTVVIAKQPLGIAFLAINAFDGVPADFPDVTRWVVGGHSLGGTVASIEADDHDQDAASPAVGLLLYASYPASNMSASLQSQVLSISGTNDGLATPTNIADSAANLPANTRFVAIDGAVHAYFGDYGPQPGDGTPTISHDAARDQISELSVGFAQGLTQ